MKVDGACFCGYVQYEAEIDPQRIGICHCTDCQITSGTVMGWGATVVDGRFELKSGALKAFVKVAESGRRRALCFCPECGTRIVSRPVEGEEGFISLRLGSCRQRDQLKPRAHIWARSAQSWVYDTSALPKVEKQA